MQVASPDGVHLTEVRPEGRRSAGAARVRQPLGEASASAWRSAIGRGVAEQRESRRRRGGELRAVQVSAAQRLRQFRAQSDAFVGLSFETISSVRPAGSAVPAARRAPVLTPTRRRTHALTRRVRCALPASVFPDSVRACKLLFAPVRVRVGHAAYVRTC